MKPKYRDVCALSFYLLNMTDSDQCSDSNQPPLFKSASTDVIISNHGLI